MKAVWKNMHLTQPKADQQPHNLSTIQNNATLAKTVVAIPLKKHIASLTSEQLAADVDLPEETLDRNSNIFCFEA